MSNKAEELASELFGAIETIASSLVSKNNQFDKTEICTITDASQASLGKYLVSFNEKTKYEAYCDPDKIYKVNDRVRVSIPNGNFSGRKYIIGKEFKETETGSNQLNILGNLNISELEDDMWNRAEIEKTISINDKYNYRDVFNVLCLKAMVKTIGDLSNRALQYGLKIKIKTEYADIQELTFTHAEMFGDPYDFDIPSPQVVAWPIPAEWGDILQITIFELDSSQAKFSDIYYGFASLLPNINDNTLKIYLNNKQPNNLLFNSKEQKFDFPKSAKKTVNFQWINKNNADVYIGFSDGKVPNASFYPLAAPFIKKEQRTAMEDYQYGYDEYAYLAAIEKNQGMISTASFWNGLWEQSQIIADEEFVVPTDELGLEIAYSSEQCLKNIGNSLKLLKEVIEIFEQYEGLDGVDESNSLFKIFNDGIKILEEKNQELQFYFLEMPMMFVNGYNYKKGTDYWSEINSILQELIEKLGNTLLTQYYDYALTQLKDFINEEAYNASRIIISKTKNDIDKINKYCTNIRSYQSEWNSKSGYFNKRQNPEEQSIGEYNTQENYISLEQNDDFISDNSNFYSLYWYKKESGSPGDSISGKGWTRINEKQDFLLYVPEDEIKEENEYLDTYSFLNKTLTLYAASLGEELEATIKAILVFDHQYFSSNTIVFSNVINSNPIPFHEGLYLQHGSQSQTHFRVYNQYNRIINSSEANTHRTLEVRYKKDKEDEKILNSAIVRWYVPNHNSQLTSSVNIQNEPEEWKVQETSQGEKCYSRILNFEMSDDNSTVVDLKQRNTFNYQILDYYNINNTFNTIRCEVEIDNNIILNSFMNFKFATYGLNGTTYSLLIEPANENKHLIFNETINKLECKISLIDKTGEPVALNGGIEVDWWRGLGFKSKQETDGYSITCQAMNNQKEFLLSLTAKNDNKYNFGILEIKIPQVKLENGSFTTLSQLVPIPYYSGTQSRYIKGPNVILYSSSGTLHDHNSYYKDNPYEVWEDLLNTSVPAKWELVYYDKNSFENYYHQGKSFTEASNTLITEPAVYNSHNDKVIKIGSTETQDKLMSVYVKPQKLWIELENPIVLVLKAITGNKDEKCSIYPVICFQDLYDSIYLNEWSDNVQAGTKTDDNGTPSTTSQINSVLIGAGKKDSNNTFSGVLMGKVVSDASISTSLPEMNGMGLYGYSKGQQAFGFGINGNAFIGTQNSGRIWFDGEKGLLASANWFLNKNDNNKPRTDLWKDNKLQPGNQGMAIDLLNGHIDAYNFKLSSEKVQISSEGNIDNKYYFVVGDDQQYMRYSNGLFEVKGMIQANSLYIADAQGRSIFEAPSRVESDNSNVLQPITVSIGGIQVDATGLSTGSEEIITFTTQSNGNMMMRASGVEAQSTVFRASLTGSGTKLEDNPTGWYNNVFKITIPSKVGNFNWYISGGANSTEVGVYVPKEHKDEYTSYADLVNNNSWKAWTKLSSSRTLKIILEQGIPVKNAEGRVTAYSFYLLINRKYAQDAIESLSNKEFNFSIKNSGEINAATITTSHLKVETISPLNNLSMANRLFISKGYEDGSVAFTMNNEENTQLIYMQNMRIDLGTNERGGHTYLWGTVHLSDNQGQPYRLSINDGQLVITKD